MATSKNITFPIYQADGQPFHGLVLRKATFDSVVMSLGDKVSGDVYYKDNTLSCSMQEYIVHSGIKYVLVNPPTIIREGMVSDNSDLKGMTKYSFEFYHPMYMLSNMPFTDVAVSYDELRYKSQDKSFFWIGYIADFVAKLNKNLQTSEWVCELNNTTISQDKLNKLSDVLSFDNNTIADALKTAFETWDVPFVIDTIADTDERYGEGKRYVVMFGLPSNEIYESEDAKIAGTPFVFKFGQGVGLKNNSATPKGNKIITRIAGYGSETNIPYGYPQIVWDGAADDPRLQYPLYDGIVGGANVRLIKHPFTRNHLMPTIYAETVNKKVNPNADGYDPDIEIKDYYDADDSTIYPHTINPIAPSYEIHQFDTIKPELGDASIVDAYPINDDDQQRADSWDDSMDGDGNYIQGYFKIRLPVLDYDIYACASITEQMDINMRSGACIGCTFTVQVDWEDYKLNFFDKDGNFAPDGEQRDYTKYPKSNVTEVELIVQKDINTFGTLMPNIYQNPKSGDKFVVLGISLPFSYIENAQERLDDAMKEYMLENNVYYFEYPLKFDEYFFTTHQYILSQIKNNTIVRFEFQGQNIPLYVKQLTIKYGDKPLPEYSITLTDDVDIVLNQIGQVTDDVSRMRLQVSALQSYFDKNLINEINNKLSRTQDDTARGKITFLRGINVGTFVHDSTGASVSVDNNGVSTLEVDFLSVRRAAKFREITIQELKHIGGELALSAAAMECSLVEPVIVGEDVTGYKCYFETSDGEKTVYQEFVVGDQALCQQFVLSDTSDGYKSTKYYWRIVKEVGDNYIVLSNVDGEYDGDGIPASGDKIVQLGYRKEYNNNNAIPYRTTAIILSATSDDAPSTKYYEGITTFSLDGIVKNEGYTEGTFHSDIYGSSYVGAKDGSSYLSFSPNDGAKVNGELSVGSRLADGTDVNNLVSAGINKLRNSGFTGDFSTQPVESAESVESSTLIYSPSFIHWSYNNGCLIRESTFSASGNEVYLSSIGVLSQEISDLNDACYVVSVKALGVDVTISFGDVTKSFTLGDSPKYCVFKVQNPTSGTFTLSTNGGCVIAEPMVAEGNVFNTWSRNPLDNDKALDEIYAYGYLMEALSQASTTINKGLLLTQLIKVGNYRNGQMVQETGGMSGLVTDENVGSTDPFLWGGGTMEQALYAIMKYKDNPAYQATDEEIAQMAKFVVTHGGRAILNDIVLRGYIYAIGGYFRGEINAEKGVFKNVHSPNGNFHIDDNGDMYASNSGRIGGFFIEGNHLTNKTTDGKFNSDAAVVFRNDSLGTFAGIGGNVSPAFSNKAVARFENEGTAEDLLPNYALILSAKGSRIKNIALHTSNGCLSGVALNTMVVDSTTTITKGCNFVVAIQDAISLTLPTLEMENDGYVVTVKNGSSGTIGIKSVGHYFDINGTYNYAIGSGETVKFIYCHNLIIGEVGGSWVVIKYQ